MLQVFQSNRLEVLVTILAEQVKMPVAANMFTADTVMVQSPGMSQWLKLQLAQTNGITANIDFPLPSSFIWRLYQGLLEGVPAESPFNKDRLTWRVYQLLPQFINHDAFSAIEQYLSCVKPTSQSQQSNAQSLRFEQLRQFQLAEKVADVFDNYLMYRPHWLEHWVSGHDDLPEDGSDDDISNQQWQPILWRALVADIESSYQGEEAENPLSRAQMHNLLMSALNQLDDVALQKVLPKRLFIFGISTLPKHQLEILNALSNHIDVQILWLNPCSLFWGDILSEKTLARIANKNPTEAALAKINSQEKHQHFIVGNPILASLGKVGRDYLDNLTRLDVDFNDVFIEQQPQTILQHIQSDILQLQFRQSQQPLSPSQLRSDIGKHTRLDNDDSLTVHSCHSRIRELEVLKDKLLGWFEQNPNLLPKDILVMMPDVDLYAPFIDAVFAFNSTSKNEFIPYTIADRAGLTEQPILSTFTALLTLPNSRFTVSELLDHLEVPAIMQKFELSQTDIVLIKQWLMDCQIKWAKDAAHKAQWGLPEIELNSWIYGLKRMLLGIALDGPKVWHQILSYQHIEGLNAVILGKLLDYFGFVVTLSSQLEGDKTLPQWHDLLQHLTDYLFLPSDNKGKAQQPLSERDLFMVQSIKDATGKLLNYQVNQDFEQSISHQIVYQYFSQELNQSGVTQRFLAGSMNFCTLMPMRSVPFKVVCVLGLNEGDYPRQVEPISFDLVGLNAPRKGDRSRKLDDRYLFLEALVSARDKLHLSYLGQSVKDNQAMMPSVILSELLEYCQQSFIDVNTGSNPLVIQHKLQPYNAQYFALDTKPLHYRSMDRNWYQLANSQQQTKVTNTDQEQPITRAVEYTEQASTDIEFSDFMDFWRHPIRYFYRQILGVKLEINEDTLTDHEVFSHDGLARYQVLNDLISAQLEHNTEATDDLLLSGSFPYKKWGEQLLKGYQQQATNLVENVQALFPEPMTIESLGLSYQLPNNLTKLLGNVSVCRVNGLFHSADIRAGEIRAQDKLALYLTHLFKCASGKAGYSLLFDHKGKLAWIEPLALDQAQALLNPWIQTFLENRHTLFNWHINLATVWAEGEIKGLSQSITEQNMIAELTPNPFKRNLASDDYCTKVVRSPSDLKPAFYQLCQQVMLALLDNVQLQSGSKKPELNLMEGKI